MELDEAIVLIKSNFLLRQNGASLWADLGSGAGLFAQALSHYLKPGSKIFAIDKKNMISPGTAKNGVEIIPVEADFEKDTLQTGKVDGILMANSLHYVRDKFSFLKKCRQEFDNEAFLIIEYDTEIPVPQWVPYPLNFESLKKLFYSSGFNSITKTGEHPSKYRRGGMYAALIRQDKKQVQNGENFFT